MKKILLSFFISFLIISFSEIVYGQIDIAKQITLQNSKLEESFSTFDLFSINTAQIYQQTFNKKENIQFSLKLGESYNWDFLLEESNIRPEGSKTTVKTAQGVSVRDAVENSTYKGFLNNNSENRVRISIREGEIIGMIISKGETYFIEPASKFDKSLNKNLHVIYNNKDVIEDKHALCGVTEERYKSFKNNIRGLKNTSTKSTGEECKLAEIALAADGSMTQKYGSIANVEQHMQDVMNVVEERYFDPEINIAYQITEMFVVDEPTNDPNWAQGSTDFVTFLEDFTAWGPTGFTASHDLASLWTNRDFDGNAVGLAWLGTVCTNNRYNVLIDFTTGLTQLVQLQAHELGHNWSAGHAPDDETPNNVYVMAPSIGTLNDEWMGQSVTAIVNHKNSRGCLDDDCTTFDWDAELTTVVSPVDGVCGDSFDPVVILKNAGNETLTSVDINYDINGANPQTFSWTGSLSTNATEEVTLPTMTAPSGTNTFNATTVSGTLNGSNVDDDTTNDDVNSSFDIIQDGSEVTLTLVTDNYGYETAWQILDDGTPILEGGNVEIIPGGQRLQEDTDGDAYPNNTTIIKNFCIAEGCYDFEIHDDWGDGICCEFGDGSYSLEDDASGTVLASGGEFGATETTNFCVPISTIQVTSTPGDLTISCEDNTDPTNTGEMTATTSCESDGLAINYEDEITAGNCENEFVITRTWTATDNCSSEETHIQVITVEDNTNPTASNPPTVSVDCATDIPQPDVAVVSDAADNCTASPTVTFENDVSDGNTCNAEIITRTYRVEDDCGNFIEVEQLIEVNATSPTFTLEGTDPTICGGADGFITISGLDASTDYILEYNSNEATTITSDATGEYNITSLEAGSYTDFTLSDANCTDCSTTDGSTITIADPNPPSVDAGANQEVCEGTLVTLSAINPDEANISWDNGVTDGESFTPSIGTETYTVTAELDGCIATDQVDVTVYSTPVIDPVNDQTECDSYTLPVISGVNLTGNEAYYTEAGGTGTQYNVGATITNTTTLYIYDESGTTPNCFDEVIFDITINNTPSVNSLNNQTACDSYLLPVITGDNLTGSEAYYLGSGGTGTQYNSGSTITISGTTTLYIYDESGTTPNCFDEEMFDVTINNTPTFSLSSTDPTACGESDGTILLNNLEANTPYEVSYTINETQIGPDTFTTDGSGTIIITGLAAGSYSSFVVSAASCLSTDNSTINLSDPNAPELDAGVDEEICEGESLTLSAFNPDEATITWNNNVTDGEVFTPEAGTTTYIVSAELDGCVSSDQLDVTVIPAIEALVSPGDLTATCDISEQPPFSFLSDFIDAGGSVMIDPVAEIDASSFTLVSEVSDGNICPETITRTYSLNDTCGNYVEAIQMIIINDDVEPIITCNVTNETILASDGSTVPDYTETISASDNCTVNPIISQSPEAGSSLNLGNNIVTMTATDDCGNVSSCIIEVLYEDDASLNENAMPLISFYPNPTTNILNIDFGIETVEATIILYDANGKLVVEQKSKHTKSESINLSPFAKGIYTVIVHTSNGSTTQKVSKM